MATNDLTFVFLVRLWEAGVAAYESLETDTNIVRGACQNKRVLEIGSGTGLLGFALRPLVSSAILTDVPSALENLRVRQLFSHSPMVLTRQPSNIASFAAQLPRQWFYCYS